MRMKDDTLEARIQRLEDREAIRSLVARYSLAVDDHDFETLGSLWAPDARYGLFDGVQAEGAEEIAALLERNIGGGGVSFHTNHDHLIDWDQGDADHASGTLITHAEISVGGKQQMCAIRYKDKYVRRQQQWLFDERLLGFLYITPPEHYPGILLRSDRLLFPDGSAQSAHWPDFQA